MPKENFKNDFFIYRTLAVGGFFLFPIFGLIYSVTNPSRYDPYGFRIFFTFLCALTFILTYFKFSYVKKSLAFIEYSLYYLVMLWMLFLLFRNNYNSNYLLGFLLVIYFTTLGIKDLTHLIIYFVCINVIYGFSVFLIDKMEVNPYFVFITFQAMFMVSYFVLRTKISLQKGIENKNIQLEEKNKDITDSITYAKRIQDAINPSESEFLERFSESFIYYQPKDVVSGDFYLLIEEGDLIFICVADCTGHGVPGAFMSMIGHSQLNNIILEKNIKEPSHILRELNLSIKKALRQDDAPTGDGMDIALFAFNKLTNTLHFSGAKRPLWIMNNKDFFELSPDKFSIGGVTPENHQFSEKGIEVKEGNILYLFTDGFADQFGGENQKKIMKSGLKKLIIQNAELPLQQQKIILRDFFNSWKKDQEQIDDVLVLALKI